MGLFDNDNSECHGCGVAHVGDCAEDPAECTAHTVEPKARLLRSLAGLLTLLTGKPIVQVGRMAGQYAKPRSNRTELVGELELPVYRGHLINGPEPDQGSRRPDPARMLACYMSARSVMSCLGWPGQTGRAPGGMSTDGPIWTSHEALLLDYEISLLRQDGSGRPLLGSTHWPWIGARTADADGAHVRLLAEVVNPVACKVGPAMDAAELLDLCNRLDPWREPGRLTLIARLGAGRTADRLPPLVRAVQSAGHPAIWLSDPMHGNTITSVRGFKTRLIDSIVQELRDFRAAVEGAGGIVGGLHLEATPDDVAECARNTGEIDGVGDRYTTLCDPRLNPAQAIEVIAAWSR